MIALALVGVADSEAAPLVDMQQRFNGINDTTFSGATTTQNGHTGAWISGYPTDSWAADTLYGLECVRPHTDDATGTWGGTPEPMDNHLTYNGREWRDLLIDVRAHQNNNNVDEDTVGIVFRWTDASNFYLAFATRSSAPATGAGGQIIVAPAMYIYRVAGGQATQLATIATSHPAGWFGMRVRAVGSRIDFYVDANNDGDYLDAGETVGVTDPAPLTTVGRVGFYELDDAFDGAAFDDLVVTIDDADLDADLVPDARDNCVGFKNPTQSDVDADRIGDTCEDDDGDAQSEQQGDCNDTNKAIYKGAPESCDSVDSNCNGDLADTFTDTDADKNPDCVDPDDDGDGVADAADCKSLDKTIYPGALEVCDAVDQDCDGDLVETFANFDADKDPDCVDIDDDNDGSLDTPDCNDANAAIYPGAAETCDLVDSDCDGDLVDGATNTDADKNPDCVDADDDNDLVLDGNDCNPIDKTVYPGAAEACDAVDSDCDGDLVDTFTDTDVDKSPDCLDLDDDNDGDPDAADCGPVDKTVFHGAPDSACDAIDSDCDPTTTGAGADFDKDNDADCIDTDDDNDGISDVVDCDDFNNKVYPSAPETCDLVDSNCDGTLTDGIYVDTDTDKTPDCVDLDDDGDGAPDLKDCAPLDKTRSPLATESCDTIDSDCDGDLVDTFPDVDLDKNPDCTDTDDDGDGVKDTADCAQYDKAIFPGQTELCDLVDSDCDASLVDAFVDFDKDKLPDCVDPDDDDDKEDDGTDCAPTNPAVNHSVAEKCNLVDDDCSGVVDDSYAKDAVTWFLDADKDGSGDATSFVPACTQPVGYAAKGDDCDDTNKAAHPGALETCARGDEDCDGYADDKDKQGASDATSWAYDGDSDLYGDPANTVVACIAPDGYLDAFSALDCDDTNPYANPDMPEVCNNGIDDDCDDIIDTDAGQSDWWPDRDEDGFGDANVAATKDCEPPDTTSTWLHSGTDCDDTDPDTNPNSAEVPDNGTDDDCDPSTPDEADTGDTGDTDTGGTETDTEPPQDTSFDSDRPLDTSVPVDTGVLGPLGDACGCEQTSGAGLAAWLAAALVVWRRKRA